MSNLKRQDSATKFHTDTGNDLAKHLSIKNVNSSIDLNVSRMLTKSIIVLKKESLKHCFVCSHDTGKHLSHS